MGALKDALAGAKEKERRKRRGGPLHLKGLTLPPKALGPFVPIYLQGVLQVGWARVASGVTWRVLLCCAVGWVVECGMWQVAAQVPLPTSS